MSSNQYDPYSEQTVLAPQGQPQGYQTPAPEPSDPYADATVLAGGSSYSPVGQPSAPPPSGFDDATVLAPQSGPQPSFQQQPPQPAFQQAPPPSFQQPPSFQPGPQPTFQQPPPPSSYGAPAYGAQSVQNPYAVPYQSNGPKNNGQALAGFICGLVGLMAFMSPIFMLSGIAGTILGALGMKACNENPEQYNNKWMGVTGMVTGFVSLVVGLLWIVLFVWLGTLS